MAYNQKIAQKIRKRLSVLSPVEEKEMMGGIAFIYNDKMCVGVIKENMMCRIDPAIYEEAVKMKGARPMDFTTKPMKGWVYINEEGIKSNKDFEYWISLALDYNKIAKSSKKKSR